MNKTELIEQVAVQTGLSKRAAGEAVDVIFEQISKTMCDGEPVRITGFGTFKAKPARGKARARLVPHTALSEQLARKLKVVQSGDKQVLVKAVR